MCPTIPPLLYGSIPTPHHVQCVPLRSALLCWHQLRARFVQWRGGHASKRRRRERRPLYHRRPTRRKVIERDRSQSLQTMHTHTHRVCQHKFATRMYEQSHSTHTTSKALAHQWHWHRHRHIVRTRKTATVGCAR